MGLRPRLGRPAAGLGAANEPVEGTYGQDDHGADTDRGAGVVQVRGHRERHEVRRERHCAPLLVASAVYRDGHTDSLVSALQALLAATPVDASLGLDGLARIVTGNFWMEDHQADALASGNVAPFSKVIRWSALARHES